jgi:hypothetical protein
MPPEIDLLTPTRGSVTAPAGCGKTQLIADTLNLHKESKPILVLTHTNAGVAALRARLQRSGVSGSAYRVATIDGFAMRLVGKFPMRSGLDPRTLEVSNPAQDYPAIRDATWRLLQAGHVSDTFRASYDRLLVDEYQDCNQSQNAIVAWAAELLPTCVLGDPMQAIFGFAGNQLVDWRTDVQPHFPPLGELQTPWRWVRAGTENLGRWLLAVRALLQAGQPVDLRGTPAEVQWIALNPSTAHQQRLSAARVNAPERNGTILVIGDARNPQGRHKLTSQTPGASTVEAVDLGDLVRFSQTFNLAAQDSFEQLVTFAASQMTGVGAANLLTRVQTLRNGRARNAPTIVEASAVAFSNGPSFLGALSFLQTLAEQPETYVYRPEMFRCCLTAMRVAVDNACTFHTASLQARERNRHFSRPLSRRSVGSTLLLKGLEADVAVILHPELMTAENLYVALTRGAKRVVVCSESPLLRPAP